MPVAVSQTNTLWFATVKVRLMFSTGGHMPDRHKRQQQKTLTHLTTNTLQIQLQIHYKSNCKYTNTKTQIQIHMLYRGNMPHRHISLQNMIQIHQIQYKYTTNPIQIQVQQSPFHCNYNYLQRWHISPAITISNMFPPTVITILQHYLPLRCSMEIFPNVFKAILSCL